MMAVVMVLASCGGPPRTRALTKPDPVGIQVVTSIPTDSLTTRRAPDLDEDDPCGGIPREIVAAEEFIDPPELNGAAGCVWVSREGLVLTISTLGDDTMAEEVAAHYHLTETGEAKYLTWLRIDGQYAVERILRLDQASTCTVTLDLSSPQPVSMLTYLIDPTGEAVAMNASESVRNLCPTSRRVAQNLVRHFKPRN